MYQRSALVHTAATPQRCAVRDAVHHISHRLGALHWDGHRDGCRPHGTAACASLRHPTECCRLQDKTNPGKTEIKTWTQRPRPPSFATENLPDLDATLLMKTGLVFREIANSLTLPDLSTQHILYSRSFCSYDLQPVFPTTPWHQPQTVDVSPLFSETKKSYNQEPIMCLMLV